MILGIVGTLGAGKGTVVEYLKQKGFAHYSASGLLKELLLEQGIEPNRDTYSKLASQIRQQHSGGLAELLWQRVTRDNPTHAIVEALHDVSEAAYVREQGGVLLGVDADLETRYARAIARGSEKDNVTFEQFKQQVAREEEGSAGHNIRAALELTETVIMNNGTLAELHTQIDEFLTQFHDRQ